MPIGELGRALRLTVLESNMIPAPSPRSRHTDAGELAFFSSWPQLVVTLFRTVASEVSSA